VITFSQGDTLYRVPAAGGRPEAVVGPDTATGALRYYSGHFLPDARHLVATRIREGGADLVVIDIEKRTVRALDIPGISPSYVDAGRLLYVDMSGTLLAVPFDASRARVTGPAEPVAENITIGAGFFARYGVSRTGTIVYYAGASTEQRELVIVEREGRAQALPVPTGPFRFPRFSPSGRRIAVTLQSGSTGVWGDVWDYDFGSQRLTRLTFDSSAQYPEWTPDGRGIVYAHRLPSGVELFRVAADGSTDPAPFFKRASAAIWESQLTPDGRHLVFREDNNVRDVLVAPVDSPAAARPLAATGFNERGIALSPDGRWLAFVSNLSGVAEVYVRRLEAGSPRWKASNGGGIAPRWGPMGRELFYQNADSVYAVSVQLGPEARIGEPRGLFAGPYLSLGNDVQWDVSRDGRRFLMIRPVGATTTTTLHVVLHRFEQAGGRGSAP
jgi:hypothetical protein